jgi:hypothetical protein
MFASRLFCHLCTTRSASLSFIQETGTGLPVNISDPARESTIRSALSTLRRSASDATPSSVSSIRSGTSGT